MTPTNRFKWARTDVYDTPVAFMAVEGYPVGYKLVQWWDNETGRDLSQEPHGEWRDVEVENKES